MVKGTIIKRSLLCILGAVTFIMMSSAVFNLYKNMHVAVKEARPTPTTFARLDIMKRNSFVRSRCQEISRWPSFKRNTSLEVLVLMEENLHLMACNNHKVGTSSITHIMTKLNNITAKASYYRRHSLFKILSPEIINKSPYKPFMFVRNPLERLVSSYKENISVRKIKGKKVSFTTYLTDILEREKTPHFHYMSFYKKCRPCDVNYRYFGTMDTFDDDMMFILHDMHINIDIIPHSNVKNARNDADDMISEVPSQIIQRIWELYQVDYYIFGYPRP